MYNTTFWYMYTSRNDYHNKLTYPSTFFFLYEWWQLISTLSNFKYKFSFLLKSSICLNMSISQNVLHSSLLSAFSFISTKNAHFLAQSQLTEVGKTRDLTVRICMSKRLPVGLQFTWKLTWKTLNIPTWYMAMLCNLSCKFQGISFGKIKGEIMLHLHEKH